MHLAVQAIVAISCRSSRGTLVSSSCECSSKTPTLMIIDSMSNDSIRISIFLGEDGEYLKFLSDKHSF